MTPERIRGFLKKVPSGAKGVELLVEVIGAGIVPIADWHKEDVEELKAEPSDSDLTSLIMEQAQEYTDAEQQAQKFLIRWRGKNGKPARTMTHRVSPVVREGEEAPAISDASIIRDLLKSIEAKDTHIATTLRTSTAAYEQTIKMLTSQLEQAYTTIADKKKETEAPLVTAVHEATDEEKEVSAQQANALKVLSDQIPSITELVLAIVADKVLSTAGGASDDDASGNGASAGNGQQPHVA